MYLRCTIFNLYVPTCFPFEVQRFNCNCRTCLSACVTLLIASAVILIEFRSSLDWEERVRNLEESASNDACRASEVSFSVQSGPDLKCLTVMSDKFVQGGTNWGHLLIVGDIYSTLLAGLIKALGSSGTKPTDSIGWGSKGDKSLGLFWGGPCKRAFCGFAPDVGWVTGWSYHRFAWLSW